MNEKEYYYDVDGREWEYRPEKKVTSPDERPVVGDILYLKQENCYVVIIEKSYLRKDYTYVKVRSGGRQPNSIFAQSWLPVEQNVKTFKEEELEPPRIYLHNQWCEYIIVDQMVPAYRRKLLKMYGLLSKHGPE